MKMLKFLELNSSKSTYLTFTKFYFALPEIKSAFSNHKLGKIIETTLIRKLYKNLNDKINLFLLSYKKIRLIESQIQMLNKMSLKIFFSIFQLYNFQGFSTNVAIQFIAYDSQAHTTG